MSPVERRRAARLRVRRSGLLPRLSALPRTTRTDCDACGNPRPWVAASEDRYGLPERVLVCPRCLLVAQVDRLTAEGARQLYRDLYRPLLSAYHGRRMDAASVARESRQRAAEIHSVLSLHADEVRGGRWVDLGGGTGGSLLGLADLGLRPDHALVVDPAPEELAVASRNGFEVLASGAESAAGWADGSRDLVLCLQAIDHLPRLDDALVNIRRALRDGGLFAFTVSDHRLGGPDEPFDLLLDHTVHLTARTVEAAAARFRFAVERLGFVRPGYLAVVLRRDDALAEPSTLPAESGEARDTLTRVLRPLIPPPAPTLRHRLYRLKRWAEKRLS